MARISIAALLCAATLGAAGATVATGARAQVVGVSWSNFQEERWKTDEAAIKAAVTAAGGTYLSADAQSSPGKQLTDIESLIARGAKAIIVLAQDANAIRPAIEKALNEGIPVIGYDRLIETRSVDVHVGRLRGKLGEAGKQIETVVGLGYRFIEADKTPS